MLHEHHTYAELDTHTAMDTESRKVEDYSAGQGLGRGMAPMLDTSSSPSSRVLLRARGQSSGHTAPHRMTGQPQQQAREKLQGMLPCTACRGRPWLGQPARRGTKGSGDAETGKKKKAFINL